MAKDSRSYQETQEDLREALEELLQSIEQELRKTSLVKYAIKIVEKFRRCRG